MRKINIIFILLFMLFLVSSSSAYKIGGVDLTRSNITLSGDGGITLADSTRIDGAEDLGSTDLTGVAYNASLASYATRSQLNATNATRINWTDVNTTLANPGLDTKLASEKAVRTAIEAIEVGDGADLSNVLNKTNPGSATGTLNITSAETRNAFKIDQNGNIPASSSVGGALLVDNTGNTGAGVVVYSDIGATADDNLINVRADNTAFDKIGLYVDYDGTSHGISINNKGSGQSNAALNVASTNSASSAVWISGNELDRGTAKITHNGDAEGDDADASALSIDLQGSGTAAQGVFVSSTAATGTTGDLLVLKNTIGSVLTKVVNVSSTGQVNIWNNNLTMDSNYITGLHSPSLSTDAATKGYVDSEISAATGGMNVTDSSANIALDDSEHQFVWCGNSGANQTITLLDAATADWKGKPVKFALKTDPGANYVRIVAVGADLVGGGAVLRTTDYPAAIEVVSNGTAYSVTSHEGSWTAGDA